MRSHLPALVMAGLSAASATTNPVVTLMYGSFEGNTTGNITSFLGMPFAEAPLGDLRFAPLLPPVSIEGVQQAFSYGAACLQQADVVPQVLHFTISLTDTLANVSEDCLFVNVLKPASAAEGDDLPVLFWIFGGSFSSGDTSQYPGNDIVDRSLTLGEPVIFVSANYRLNAFGFLASEEVQNANVTNIGLRDQRFAMEWVNHYISQFGGDPSKVTIWGESAGSFSVGLHMVLNDGDPQGLFRAGVMESGSAYALRNESAGQEYYVLLVDYTGCSGEADTLACLHQAPAEQIVAAVNVTPSPTNYTVHNLAWQPRLDDLFQRNPQRSILMGRYAKVPIISGDCDDEGTLFSLGDTNITTDDEFLSFVNSNYIPVATPKQIEELGKLYPDDSSLGSPFNTGVANELTTEYKRIAAFTGDWQFQASRRYTLETMSKTQDAWAYLYRRGKTTPYLGSYHSSDLDEFFASGDYIGMDALINFVSKLDPNAAADLPANVSYLSEITWDRWASNKTAPPLLTFQDSAPLVNITTDTFREEPIFYLTNLSLQFP